MIFLHAQKNEPPNFLLSPRPPISTTRRQRAQSAAERRSLGSESAPVDFRRQLAEQIQRRRPAGISLNRTTTTTTTTTSPTATSSGNFRRLLRLRHRSTVNAGREDGAEGHECSWWWWN
jgi:hypothetical protein